MNHSSPKPKTKLLSCRLDWQRECFFRTGTGIFASSLVFRMSEDFKQAALGNSKPQYNEEIGRAIDAACSEPQDRQILRMFLAFNQGVLLTNFFKEGTPGAFAFRLDPKVALKDRPASLYPEVPFGIYLVSGRDFLGFHVRFRDVARGGVRLVLSRDQAAYERNFATLFDEAYNLAFTQQMKNKDISLSLYIYDICNYINIVCLYIILITFIAVSYIICISCCSFEDIPEGGAKGIILADFTPG